MIIVDQGRMVKKTEDKEQILTYYQKVYDIKKELGLPVPTVRPQKVSTVPELLIFNRWTHMDKRGRRKTHLCRMEEILQREKVTYSIISEV